jgi:hypothetical protein
VAAELTFPPLIASELAFADIRGSNPQVGGRRPASNWRQMVKN